MEIKVKYFGDQEELRFIRGGDWIDLRTAEEYNLREGDFKILRLGVAIKLPEGYEALVVPRSSTFKNYGILQANSFGVIDNSYCGNEDEWRFPAYATRDMLIPKGARICQFRITENQPKFDIVKVEKLDDESRGGFGSTGII